MTNGNTTALTLTPTNPAVQAAVKTGPLPRPLRNILSLQDFEDVARRYLPRSIFAFASSGVQEQLTLRENCTAFDDYRLLPRVLVGVENRSQSATLFGRTYASPFGVAPMGMESLISYRGDLRIAEACAANNIPFVQSGASLIRLEELRAVCPNAWFQAYLTRQYDDTRGLLRRLEKAGFETLVVTVDMTTGGNRENMVRAGFSAPFRPSLRLLWDGVSHPSWSVGNFARTIVRHGTPHFENIDGGRGAPIISRTEVLDNNRSMHNWDVIRSIRAEWPGTLIIKGLLNPRDVRIAVEAGVDGIIISSHGGRQIDGVIAPIRMLGACIAVAGDVPVMIDSGIRRGTDIIKCFALGAKFVFVGRPFNYAAILGRIGVEHAISLLRTELSRDMGNMGLNSLSDIAPECILPANGPN